MRFSRTMTALTIDQREANRRRALQAKIWSGVRANGFSRGTIDALLRAEIDSIAGCWASHGRRLRALKALVIVAPRKSTHTARNLTKTMPEMHFLILGMRSGKTACGLLIHAIRTLRPLKWAGGRCRVPMALLSIGRRRHSECCRI